MKAWKGWKPVTLLGAATVVAAYLLGSARVSAALDPCNTCTCKNVYAWKVQTDDFAQGLVDNMGAPVLHGMTGLCVLNGPNTPDVILPAADSGTFR